MRGRIERREEQLEGREYRKKKGERGAERIGGGGGEEWGGEKEGSMEEMVRERGWSEWGGRWKGRLGRGGTWESGSMEKSG